MQKAKAEQKKAEDQAFRCEQIADVAIDEIKAGVDARIAQAPKEAVLDTCSGFLYTLWLNHPKLDFSFFSDEAVEEVKQYTADAAQNAKVSALPDPFEVAPPAVQPEVPPAEVQLAEAAEV